MDQAALVSRAAIAPVDLPSEVVDVPAIGGAVLVRGMNMPQLLAFSARKRGAMAPLEGETEQAAAERAGAELLPELLAVCVLAGDGLPVYTAAQWAAFGSRHPQVAVQLWERAVALSGQDLAAEKKT